jgi:tRNA (adenine57-N1/adenine58-N1)-methyltransferase
VIFCAKSHVCRQVNFLTEITMHEALLRPHDVSTTPPAPSIATAAARLLAQEVRREEKRLVQIATARARHVPAKRKAEDTEADEGAPDGKKVRVEAIQAEAETTSTGTDAASIADTLAGSTDGADKVLALAGSSSTASASQDRSAAPPTPLPRRGGKVIAEETKTVLSRPFSDVRGHTSYLTFACLVPHSTVSTPALATIPSSTSTETLLTSATVDTEPETATIESSNSAERGQDEMVVDAHGPGT